ncbi:MAG: peptidoglycan-binding protein [Scytonema sp. PMC 1069.18]|nr:peptidoglycan-binding protein [Scytonema sp. PMC 1069.18]MEC4880258.1 peptidoglycan-binding protein [Scytonema sp. PMC 1070.18]
MSSSTSILPLKEGSTGSAVARIQEFLTTLKFYSGQIDGVFGPQTKAAVIKFQQNQGLTVDGIVGTQTAIALDDAVWVSQRETLREGSKGDEVRNLQELFTNYFKAVNIDGIFGPKTKAVVIEFQKARGLNPDGIVGPKTWDSLYTLVTHDIPVEQRIEFIFGEGC